MAHADDRDREERAPGTDAPEGLSGNRMTDPASGDATMGRREGRDPAPRAGAHGEVGEEAKDNADNVNPPRTTTGRMTSPKFGSAGSGGAELEPGPGS